MQRTLILAAEKDQYVDVNRIPEPRREEEEEEEEEVAIVMRLV